MTITSQQTGIALLVALILHGAILFWLTLPAPEPLPEPPEQTVRVSLLATIAESSTATEAVTPPQQKIKPPAPPKPKPVPKPEIQEPLPKPVAEPITQQPAPVIEPAPQPEPLPIESPPEIVKEAVPIQEPAVTAPSPAPLSATAMAEYEQLLVAWLEKQKKYPKRAQRMRIEGEGRLRIVIDRSGQAQKITLEQRTGNRLLDKAALEMAKRANPFPPMPENDLRQTLEFIVPVVFSLR